MRFQAKEQIARWLAGRDAVSSLSVVNRIVVINPIGSGEVAVGLERETAAGRRPRNGHG